MDEWLGQVLNLPAPTAHVASVPGKEKTEKGQSVVSTVQGLEKEDFLTLTVVPSVLLCNSP